MAAEERCAAVASTRSPSWHKYSWLAEFVANIPHYERNTVDTTRLAIEARRHLFAMARRENIDFDLEQRGILHIYRDKAGFDHAARVNALLRPGGLERHAVTPAEMKAIEPALDGEYLRRLLHAVGFDRRHPQVHARPRRGLPCGAARRFVYDADVDSGAAGRERLRRASTWRWSDAGRRRPALPEIHERSTAS